MEQSWQRKVKKKEEEEEGKKGNPFRNSSYFDAFNIYALLLLRVPFCLCSSIKQHPG